MMKEEIQKGLMEVVGCVAHDSLMAYQHHAALKVARRHIRFLCDLIEETENRGVESLTKRTIRVVLRNGRCVALQNLPSGWLYDVDVTDDKND